MNGLTRIGSFRPWVKKMMPTVYDDSLTYYELLVKVIGYLNQLIDQSNELIDWIDGEFDGIDTDLKKYKQSIDEILGEQWETIIDNKRELDSKLRQIQVEFEEVKLWLENEALPDSVEERLDIWFDSGKLADIINNDVFDMKANQEDLELLSVDMMDRFINVKNFNDLKNANELDKEIVLNVGRKIPIEEDITLNEKLTLSFSNNGALVIPANRVVTLNSYVEGDRTQIFEFEDITSILTTNRVKFGNEESSTKVHYQIKPEWFGVKANAYPSNNYLYENLSHAIGTDSTQPMKRTMKFAEDSSAVNGLEPNRSIHPSVTVSFAPNSVYYLQGNNPLGIQSSTADVGYSVWIEGNGATILWKPNTKSDVLLGKYGRIIKPYVRNFNVVLLGEKGQRWGSFISTKTNEGDLYHLWNGGLFENLRLGTHDSVGFDSVFDIDVDGSHSHDDLTKLFNISLGSYNTFLNIKNNESVNWLLEKVMFSSGTEGATHINIASGFSGGLTINSCELLLRHTNETFIKTGSDVAGTPIKFINGRMETRGSNPICLIDGESGEFEVNNIRVQSGNSSSLPHINTRTAKLGLRARAKFENCTLYDRFDVKVGSGETQKPVALDFEYCSFIGRPTETSSIIRTFGYPSINYLYGENNGNLSDVIRNGYRARRISVLNPAISDGSFILPITYGTHKANLASQTAELYNLENGGKPTTNIQGLNSLPPNIVITSIKLYANQIETSLTNRINIVFYQDGNPGENNSTLNFDLQEDYTEIGTELLNNQIIILPVRSYIVVQNRGVDGRIENPSQMPVSWLEIEYRAISKESDTHSNTTNIIRRNIF